MAPLIEMVNGEEENSYSSSLNQLLGQTSLFE